MRTIAIVNQKGGCGKTTTAVNLAGCLDDQGARVLVVDLDPQAHATLALGLDPEGLDENLYEVLAEADGRERLGAVLQPVSERLDVAPSGIVLSALEQKLATERADARTERLREALAQVAGQYDFALIDCPPNVGILTFNALRAAGEVIVPLESSYFAIDGVQKLLDTIALLAERVGHDLSVRILPTLYDGRTRFARETLAEIRSLFGELCFDTVIRGNVKLREAARRGLPISRFARSANGAQDYAALAVEVAAASPDDVRPLAEARAAAAQRAPRETASAPRAPAAAPRETAPRAARAPSAAPSPSSSSGGGPHDPARAARHPSSREVVVHFRDADARDVRIAGDFNGWVPDKDVQSQVRAEDGDRIWTKVLSLPPGTYQYRYVVDGEWRADPENPRAVQGPVGGRNSVLVVS